MFLSNISVDAAHSAIVQHVRPLTVISTPLRTLNGRVLAQSIVMERDQPPFDRVTMDGIALCSDANVDSRQFRITGTQAAGAAPLMLNAKDHCIEVMTGAQLPIGCDCVVPVERIHIDHGMAKIDDDLSLTPYLNVHRRGSDSSKDDEILRPGTHMSAAEVAVIASAGYSEARVYLTPRIAVISTGDELVEPGSPIEAWQIRRSNTYALISALNKYGFSNITDAHLRDDPVSLRTKLSAMLEQHDVLILSGGVSAGKFDYIPKVLNEIGVTTIFHKILQRPGKPMWFGIRDDGKAIYALPGNPVSILVCFYRYVLNGLRQAMGATKFQVEHARLTDAIKSHDQLTCFVPVKLNNSQAILTATPHPTRGSGDFVSLLGTDGFVQLPASSAPIPSGTIVPLYRW